MTSKKVIFVLMVGLLAIGTVGFAIAEAPVVGMYDRSASYLQADPESGVGQLESWQPREAIETGSVPDMSDHSTGFTCCSDNDRFRPGIDDGP